MATHMPPPQAAGGAGSSTPPRRTFGSAANGNGNGGGAGVSGERPLSTVSASSMTPSNSMSHLAPPVSSPSYEPNRGRSPSSASTGSAAQLAAERATQWLSSLAPRGEGRGREFITNTLSGVATVASTVGQEVNGFIAANAAARNGASSGHSRPNSFSASSPPNGAVPVPYARRDSARSPSPSSAAANANGTTTTGRRIPQPANISRLGGAAAHGSALVTSPIASPTSSSFHRGPQQQQQPGVVAPGHRTTPSQSSLAPPGAHAHAHTAPGAGAYSARRGSSHAHTRTGSAGLATSPALSATSEVNPATAKVRQAGMPYKIGFQPSGVRNDRSGEFMRNRKALASERDKEEGRLGRRWAKLVDLHFNPAMQVRPPGMTRSPSSSSMSTTGGRKSLLSMDGALDSLKPREVWKGLKMAAGPNPEEARKRAAEQSIVKWEEDAEVKKCRICQASFTLSTRKHHCRLCGRIVCSLPPTPPALLAVQVQLFAPADPDAAANPATASSQAALPPGTRREKCSLLLVADYKTGRGEEVDEGFVGWMTLDETEGKSGANGETSPIRRAKRPPPEQRQHGRQSSIASEGTIDSRSSTPLPQQPQEVQVKGVRVCRDCWGTVSRKQRMADLQRVSLFQRLYYALRATQSEIESLLPDFEEGLGTLKAAMEPEEPSLELLDLHKQLLALLGQYDAIAKRISNLPCEDGGSQQTVQGAIARTAAVFLAKAMVTVQELPKLQRMVAAAKAKTMVIVESQLPDVLREEGVRDDEVENVAAALQPLLEQQAQLESFIAEANAQRKYDDSRALATALADIESEIARLTTNALK